MTRRLAVFDCDGTLVDSQANICAAMEHSFAAHALPAPDRAAIRRIVGLSLVEAMAALLPDAAPEQHRDMAADYKCAFQTLRGNGGLIDEPLFEGVVEALDAFEAAGWLLGVATGKSDRGLSLILAHHGLSHRFVTLQTADRHPSKPHPAMVHAALAEAGAAAGGSVMIGDTSFDMAMGVAAGVRPIGVAWGYHDAHELRDAGALAVADRADELVRLAQGTY